MDDPSAVHLANTRKHTLLKEHAEQLTLIRWLSAPNNAATLMAHMGVHEPWWCGLNLDRGDVLSEKDRDGGDIDIVAGPLDASNGAPWWPPRLTYLAACEVKASWYAVAKRGKWMRTHRRDQASIVNGLIKLRGHGFDSVMPQLLAASDAPHAGYFRAVVGSIGGEKTEGWCGSGGLLRVVRPPVLGALGTADHTWRVRLHANLSRVRLHKHAPHAFIPVCPKCECLTSGPAVFGIACKCGWQGSLEQALDRPRRAIDVR